MATDKLPPWAVNILLGILAIVAAGSTSWAGWTSLKLIDLSAQVQVVVSQTSGLPADIKELSGQVRDNSRRIERLEKP